MEVLEMVLGEWLQNHFLGPLKCKLQSLNSEGAHYGRKGIRTVDVDLLLAFILKCAIQGLIKQRKHRIRHRALEELEQQLMGKNRFKALNRCLAFGPEQQVEDCLSSLHTYLFRVVLPGTNVCVDETHFFRIMANLPSMLGLLQHIKGKPYDYGLVTYMAAQTLLFTGLPICL